jgi:hypothetical protein
MTTKPIRPSRWYYLLAPLVFGAAVGVFALLVIKGIGSIDRDLSRIIFPGTATLHLARVASYTVFYENESIVNGRVFSTGEKLSEMNCSLAGSGSGAAIPLHRPSTRTSYQTGKASGVSVLEFQLKSPGDYEMTCNYVTGQTGEAIVFAIGPEIGSRIWITIVPALLTMFGGFTLALGIVIWTYLKRKLVKSQESVQSAISGASQEALNRPNS